MSKAGRNLQNLKTPTAEEARKLGRNGGIKSGIVRKEKKLMSQILAEYLAKEHEVILRDKDGKEIDRSTLSAQALIEQTVTAILSRGDSASATIIKTLGELTEGSKIKLSGDEAAPIEFKIVDPPCKSRES